MEQKQRTRKIIDPHKVKMEYLQKALKYKKQLQEVKKRKQQKSRRKRKELLS